MNPLFKLALMSSEPGVNGSVAIPVSKSVIVWYNYLPLFYCVSNKLQTTTTNNKKTDNKKEDNTITIHETKALREYIPLPKAAQLSTLICNMVFEHFNLHLISDLYQNAKTDHKLQWLADGKTRNVHMDVFCTVLRELDYLHLSCWCSALWWAGDLSRV